MPLTKPPAKAEVGLTEEFFIQLLEQARLTNIYLSRSVGEVLTLEDGED